MATVDEVRDALRTLAKRMDDNAAQVQGKINLDRPLACSIRDLDVAFHGRLTNGRLVGMTDGDDPHAKIRLTATSDDLVSLVEGRLNLAKAWAAGRVSINANPFDLLKLSKLI
jgi:predicted lipid carrier protein YhbT